MNFDFLLALQEFNPPLQLPGFDAKKHYAHTELEVHRKKAASLIKKEIAKITDHDEIRRLMKVSAVSESVLNTPQAAKSSINEYLSIIHSAPEVVFAMSDSTAFIHESAQFRNFPGRLSSLFHKDGTIEDLNIFYERPRVPSRSSVRLLFERFHEDDVARLLNKQEFEDTTIQELLHDQFEKNSFSGSKYFLSRVNCTRADSVSLGKRASLQMRELLDEAFNAPAPLSELFEALAYSASQNEFPVIQYSVAEILKQDDSAEMKKKLSETLLENCRFSNCSELLIKLDTLHRVPIIEVFQSASNSPSDLRSLPSVDQFFELLELQSDSYTEVDRNIILVQSWVFEENARAATMLILGASESEAYTKPTATLANLQRLFSSQGYDVKDHLAKIKQLLPQTWKKLTTSSKTVGFLNAFNKDSDAQKALRTELRLCTAYLDLLPEKTSRCTLFSSEALDTTIAKEILKNSVSFEMAVRLAMNPAVERALQVGLELTPEILESLDTKDTERTTKKTRI